LTELPNRRIRDPYVRWCGRRGTARSLPIPISQLGPSGVALNSQRWHTEPMSKAVLRVGCHSLRSGVDEL
jgi:hypothetical protein